MGDDTERTLFCGNLSEEATEELLFELFLQAGPLQSVTIPKENSGRQKNFAFVIFKHAVSVPYTIALFHGLRLYGRELQLDHRTGAGSRTNKFLEGLLAYKSATGNQIGGMASHRRTSSVPEKILAQNVFDVPITFIRNNPRHIYTDPPIGKERFPQPYRRKKHSFQAPNCMDSRMSRQQSYHRRFIHIPSLYHRTPRYDYRSAPLKPYIR